MNAIATPAVDGAVWSGRTRRPLAFRKVVSPKALSVALLVSLPLSSCSAPPDAVANSEEVASEVEGVARAFLEALSQADTATLRGLMASDVSLSSVREGPEGPVVRHSTGEDFLGSLGGESRSLLERMWDPTVHVQGRVAVVWTPYDFFLDGEFSHCGIDVFTLLEGEGGWRVTGVTYNVVQEECPPSPLGPPVG